ncbi:nucleotide-diphospho-sugar transferase [Lipomyces oligophaga]|uniref:nucleotide-diphospho-sugar transferase n=1 Tax=Lipomyces oligophaga TaxID=45792 RepID=UPI0034CEA1FE
MHAEVTRNKPEELGKFYTEEQFLASYGLKKDDLTRLRPAPFQLGHENATLVMLVRNRELGDALRTMRMLEDRFNRNYRYPWIFLNDEPFEASFIEYTKGMASGQTHYGLIDYDQWSVPSFIDTEKTKISMEKLVQENVIYAGSMSYRHMCRYNSGFFFRHPLVQSYEWYWRVEPGVEYFCDLTYDPFTYMKDHDKTYGFVMAMYEYQATIPTLWDATKQFVAEHPQYLAVNNSLDFFVDFHQATKEGEVTIEGDFNLCHFWSNFEIANLNFWRSEAYMEYFSFLDKQGGFFYERWGDAPVHSLAVGLFLPKSKIHHFGDIGYKHPPYSRCPQDEESHSSGRCFCSRGDHFDDDSYSCLPRWWNVAGMSPGAGNKKID